MHLDILVQLIILNNDEQDLLGTTGQYLATLAGVFCGPRDFVVGTSYSTDQPGCILCSGFTINHVAPAVQTKQVDKGVEWGQMSEGRVGERVEKRCFQCFRVLKPNTSYRD